MISRFHCDGCETNKNAVMYKLGSYVLKDPFVWTVLREFKYCKKCFQKLKVQIK